MVEPVAGTEGKVYLEENGGSSVLDKFEVEITVWSMGGKLFWRFRIQDHLH